MRLFPGRTWEMSCWEKKVYLSFDDGPHPLHTGFVLDELKKYNAKATFFCVGENVKSFPGMYERILAEGHSTGNHTMHHLKSNTVSDEVYFNDIEQAADYIDSRLFRPPYGRLSPFRAKLLSEMKRPYQIIMWTLLSGDFDKGISPTRCLENVLLKAGNGSIVVFHDSEKAAEKLRSVLPAVLKSFSERGFTFEKISPF